MDNKSTMKKLQNINKKFGKTFKFPKGLNMLSYYNISIV